MTLTDADRLRIAERYPERRRPWLVPVIAVPLVALLALWIWISVLQSNPPLTAEAIRFQVVSDTETRITIRVDRSRPEVSGRCLVFAQAPNFERVGEVMVPIGPSDRAVDEVEVSIRTFRRASAASADTCTAK